MNYIVIVAGGKGQRMGSELPKQFLLIGGKPILMHTIERFYEYDKTLNIILVLPEEQQDLWRELCNKYAFTIEHQIVNVVLHVSNHRSMVYRISQKATMDLLEFMMECVLLYRSIRLSDVTTKHNVLVLLFP